METKLKKKIARDLKIDKLSAKKQNEIIVKLQGLIQEKLALSVQNALAKKDQEILSTLSERGDMNDVNNFLEGKIPNLKSLIRSAAVSVVEEYKNK